MYGDSCEKLLDILPVVIVSSPISSVRGIASWLLRISPRWAPLICLQSNRKKISQVPQVSSLLKVSSMVILHSTAYPIWGEIFAKLFQSSKLKVRTSIFTETWQQRGSSFELWNRIENVTPSGIGCTLRSELTLSELTCETCENFSLVSYVSAR